MGGALKTKTMKEVCDMLLSCIYRYGSPRILQTDNGKEFNNGHLSAVMEELKTRKINGRPYHPQSQGRVERLNQTLGNFLKRDLQNDKNWLDRLPFFYFSYNNRVHGSLRGRTPFELYMKRPNFSFYTPYEGGGSFSRQCPSGCRVGQQ